MSDDEIADTLAWFRNLGEYDTNEERNLPKYIAVVNILNEGADIPELNLVVIAKSFGENAAGFKSLVQNFGRGTRPGTDGLRLIDYSGFSRVLIDNVHFVMPVAQGHRRPSGDKSTPGVIQINDQVVFVEQVLEMNFDSLSFAEKYPEFDHQVFSGEDGALQTLFKYSRILGVPNFYDKFGARDTLMSIARHLKSDDERTRLIEDLSRFAWAPSDANNAFREIQSAQERIYLGLRRINQCLPESRPRV